MAFLVYDVLADPAPLQVSEAGGASRGAVYIVVSHPKDQDMAWVSLTVRVPFGQQEDALTSDPKAVTARVLPDKSRQPDEEPLTGHLSVRNGTDWLTHVNDGQVAIEGNLRVHGAFRSDS